MNEVESYEMTYDDKNGRCCVECAEYFQGERDLFDDNMRKQSKEEMFYD
jgi:hypothetical protein